MGPADPLYRAFEASGHGLWEWEVESGRVHFSEGWWEMLGLSADDEPQTLASWSSRVHPDDLAGCVAAIERHFAGETPRYSTVHRLLHRDGTYRWVLDQGKVVTRDPTGRPLLMVGTHTEVTSIKDTQEQLERLLAYLQATLDNFPFLVWLKDADSRFLSVNQVFATTCGHGSAEALRGLTDLDVWPADLARAYQDGDRRVLETGERLNREELIADESGQRWYETYKAPVRLPNGTLLGTVGFARDVTERRAAEQAREETMERLAESEENFRAFFDTVDDLLFVLDAEGRILHTNRLVHERLGYSAEELRGRSVLDVHPAPRRAEALHIVQEMLAGRRDRCPVPLESRSGQLIPVETRVVAGRWGGAPALFGVTRDMSAVLASESKFSAVFRHAPIPMAISDPHGALLEVNEAFEEVTGYASHQVVGRRAVDLGLFADLGDRAAVLDEVERRGPVVDREVGVRTRTGEIRRGLFTASPIVLQDRHLLLTQMVDITERKAAEAELRASEERYRAVAEHMSDALLVLDRDARVLFANPAADRRFAQASPDALVGRSLLEALPGPSAAELLTHVREVSEGERPFQGEVPIPTAAGTSWFLFRMDPIRLPGLDGRYVLSLSRDVSEARAAQEVLRRDRDLFSGGPVGVLVWDLDARWTVSYASPNIAAILGVSSSELLDPAVGFASGVPAEGRDRVASEVRERLAAGRSSWEQRFAFVRPDGHRRCLFVFASVEPQAEDRPTRLRGYVMDVTERQESEARLRLAATVFDYAHEAIMICDADEVIRDVNPTFTTITGYARAEALGNTPRLLASGRHGPEFYAGLWADLRGQHVWSGEIWNRNKGGAVYVARMTISAVHGEDGRLTHYIAVFSDVTLLKSHQERLELLAHYDALTRLPNRALLADRMQQALARAERTGELLAVAYLDLDDFKPINDRLGHDVGDLLLVEVAQRLRSVTRGGDTVARLGGDEFVLLLTEPRTREACDKVAARVLAALSAPLTVAGHDLRISASMGLTLYPEDDADADTLIRHADQAMYDAKLGGRNRFQVYDPRRDVHLLSRRQTCEAVGRALERGELCLYYQPKVDMRSGRVLGAEALVRWQHPERGLIPPGEFLPQLEGHILQVELDLWVLGEVWRQRAAWLAAGLELEVSLNLCGPTVLHPTFLDELRRLAHGPSGARPQGLVLEVLETAALADVDRAGRVFRECRALGFAIALDDFGTGYSSLTYFRRLPADILKIDQTFIRDMLDNPDDMAIVESVIGLTHAFGRQVVAEGVETTAIGAVLVHMGCDLAQGYAIARPMPAAALPDWIRGFQPDPGWRVAASWPFARDDVPLAIMGLEHDRWCDSLRRAVSMPPGSPRDESLLDQDGASCHFGRWLKGLGERRYGKLPEFREVEQLHAEIHALAHEVLARHDDGDSRATHTELERMAPLREELHGRLTALQRLSVHLYRADRDGRRDLVRR